MTDVVKQAHDAVVDEMITQKKLRTDQSGRDAVNEVFGKTLGHFLEHDPNFWVKPEFKKFILLVADDIVSASTDLAYVRHRDPKLPHVSPLVRADDISDAAKAVMVRHYDECGKFFAQAPSRGPICPTFVEEPLSTEGALV